MHVQIRNFSFFFFLYWNYLGEGEINSRLIRLIDRAPSFDYFYPVFRARPAFQQRYHDYFFLFIRNELETIDEDDTLEVGSLPNFRNGIHVKLPQRLLFDARHSGHIFFFLFLRQFSTPKFLISLPFPSLYQCENVKNHSCAFSSRLFFLLSQ